MKRESLALFVSAIAIAAALSFRWGLFNGLLMAIFAVPVASVLAGTLGLPVLAILRRYKWNAWWQSVSLGILSAILLLVLWNGAKLAQNNVQYPDELWLDSKSEPVMLWIGAATGGLTWLFGIRNNPDFVDSRRSVRPIWGRLASVMLALLGIASLVMFFAIERKDAMGDIPTDAASDQVGGLVSVTLNNRLWSKDGKAIDRTGERIYALAPSHFPIRPGCSVYIVYRKFLWSSSGSYFITGYIDFSVTPIDSQEWRSKIPPRCD